MAQRVPLTSKPTQTRRTKVIAEVIISDNEDETSEEKAVALESDEDLVTHASQNSKPLSCILSHMDELTQSSVGRETESSRWLSGRAHQHRATN